MKCTIFKKSIIKNIVLLFTVMLACVIGLHAQDEFNVTRLTFDPAQEGFPTWSPDGKFIFYSYSSRDDSLGKNGLWKMTPDGTGTQQIFAGLAEHPKWSPDGRYIVFDADTGKSIKMILIDGGAPIHFLPDSIRIIHGGMPCWSADGTQIAFLEGASLSVCIANIETGKVIKIFRQEGMLPFPGCWTRDGKSILITLMDRQSRKSTVWKISAGGKEKKQITGHHEGLYRHLALSPDGSLLVYAAMEGRELGLWIMLSEGGKSLPLVVTHSGHNESPNWSPDGKRIAFTSTRSGNFDVWLMDVDISKVKKELQVLNN